MWRRLMQALTAFAWFLVAVLLARFTWSLINPAEPDDSAVLPIVTVDSTATGSMNLETLTALNLFGAAERGNRSESVQNAPKTSLNVRLIGVSASSNPERSAAIIQQGSKQQTYIIGESLGSSSVTVEEIHADRVILDNNGRLETLKMEDIGEDRPALSLIVGDSDNSGALVPVDSDDSNPVNDDATVEQQLAQVADNPSSLLDYVNISPVQINGELKGYKLNSGKNPELFRDAGFQNGDLAVAINGFDLTDMEQAMLASQELSEQERVTIEIERGGERMELSFELPVKQDN
ncbi:type II secretion system protein GspC [Idiomarina sp. M1R2S28]|uniref:Type II secretion system protein GspC n=1 Tax=Idiomarina rhizosphaerae TaxID=2961572 RepID=A0A9X2FX18_9GAMM|nr:type II secretion system protein GspC [Idiomarina rhizosphaerae]MCP1339205.1 type II secretion system protein GspC [Idiomarina rhizosphaerae]